MQGLGAFLTDDLQIRLPHIGADEDDLRCQFVTDDFEETLKGFDGPLAAYPEQAGDVEIDLINQRQILVAFGVLNLVDSDSVDLAEHPMFQPKGDDMFDSVENLIP